MCALASPSADVAVVVVVGVDVDVEIEVEVEVEMLELVVVVVLELVVVVVVGAVPVVTVTVTVVVLVLRGFFFCSPAIAAAKGLGEELVVMSASPTPASAANARPTIAATTEPRARGFDCLGTGLSLRLVRGACGLRR